MVEGKLEAKGSEESMECEVCVEMAEEEEGKKDVVG